MRLINQEHYMLGFWKSVLGVSILAWVQPPHSIALAVGLRRWVYADNPNDEGGRPRRFLLDGN